MHTVTRNYVYQTQYMVTNNKVIKSRNTFILTNISEVIKVIVCKKYMINEVRPHIFI